MLVSVYYIIVLCLLLIPQYDCMVMTHVGGPLIGNQYGNITVPQWPGGRYDQAMTLLSDGSFLIYGGLGYDIQNKKGELSDLWRLDQNDLSIKYLGGPTIARQKGNYTSPSWPGGRYGHSMLLLKDGSIIMFGGFAIGDDNILACLSDLWRLNPNDLTFNYIGGPTNANQRSSLIYNYPVWPGGRYGHAMVLLNNGSVLLYGGYGDYNAYSQLVFYSDIWRWDPDTLIFNFIGGPTSINTRGNYTNPQWPGGRYSHTMILMRDNSVIMYGGRGYDSQGTGGGSLSDLWRLNLIDLTFQFLGGPTIANQKGNYTDTTWPGGRVGHSMVYLNDGSVLLYGGAGYDTNSYGTLSDLWRLSTNDYSFQFIGGSTVSNQKGIFTIPQWPGGRTGHSMIMSNQKLVLFGGNVFDGPNEDIMSDVWSLADVPTSYPVPDSTNIEYTSIETYIVYIEISNTSLSIIDKDAVIINSTVDNMEVLNSNTSIHEVVKVNQMALNNSTISLAESSTLLIKGSLLIESSSTIELNERSSIIIGGCVNGSNLTISVKSKLNNTLLLRYDLSCGNGSNINFQTNSESSCEILSTITIITNTSVDVYLDVDNQCTSSLDIIIIVIIFVSIFYGSVVLIVLLIVFILPGVRRQIFPQRQLGEIEDEKKSNN